MKKQRLPNTHAPRPTIAGAAFGIACGSKAPMVRLEFDWLEFDRTGGLAA